MRFYTKQHKFYCGIDLDTKKMYFCILDDKSEIRLHHNITTDLTVYLAYTPVQTILGIGRILGLVILYKI